MSDNTARKSENSFGQRFRRYAQVSTTVAGQAAKIAGRRITGGSFDRGEHAGELKAILGGMKGPLMKVAQMMATIPDALPSEYAAELAQLQSQAPSMGHAFVRRRMRGELGEKWQDRFASFELDAAAAASLGQVHKATLNDGRPAACKLQYPNIEATVEADLRQLRLLIGFYKRYDRAIDPSLIYQEIEQRLREELDYVRERRQMALYRHMLAKVPHVHVPEPIEELSTDRLLTMIWLQGDPLMQFKTASQEDRNRLAMNMFHAWYVPFYEYGIIHGDPHLGNYTVREDLDVNLLDFGCIRIFPPMFVKGVIDLYWAIAKDDRDLAVSAYECWGFKDLDNAVIDVLNEWARFLYGPLMENRARKIQENSSGQYGREVAQKVHQQLREVGGVTPPREFVFMDRAAIGLGSVFMHLSAEINWHDLFMDMIDGFDVEKLEARQNAALAEAGLNQQAIDTAA